jgi:hypothetical protein
MTRPAAFATAPIAAGHAPRSPTQLQRTPSIHGPKNVYFTAAALLATCLSSGCALTHQRLQPFATPVWVRSHNQSPVDVYLLCGSRDAKWLGAVGEQQSDALEIPAGQPYCVEGLNFFLVVRDLGRGYWVGPIRPERSDAVQLVIEKYAGLSSAQLVSDMR